MAVRNIPDPDIGGGHNSTFWAEHFWLAYHCAARNLRMIARPLNNPIGGIIVHYEDQPGISRTRHERTRTRAALTETRRRHTDQVAAAHEQLGQSLTAISLAAVALREGGNVGDAVTLISLAVEEARLELRKLRFEAERDAG